MPHWLRVLLLALYARSLRHQYADDLTAALDDAWRREGRTHRWIGALLVVVQVIGDAARVRLGSHAESRWLRQHRVREPRRTGLQNWISDVRYAIRTFRTAPAFFASLVLTLALGIGANTAVFSLVKAVVLQPLPYERPGELVMLWRPSLSATQLQRSQATPRFVVGWRDRAADIVTVAAVNANLEGHMDFQAADRIERLTGGFATSNFFEVIGARPLLGRVFTAADEAAGATDVVVLSHDVWAQTFGSDPAILGRTITLTAGRGKQRVPRALTVIGVLPPGFHFKYPEHVKIWAVRPWTQIATEPLDAISYLVVGRLQPGVSFQAASERLAALHEVIRPRPAFVPLADRQTTKLERVDDWVLGDSKRTMALLAGVAGLLLLIACATVANALLIRVTERRRELALRTAMGATRVRLLRQLLVEGAVLAAVGTVAGTALALVLMPILRALVPATVPRGDEIGIDPIVFWFAAAVVALVTLLAALAPAWRGSSVASAAELRRTSASVTIDRSTALWRRSLVALQAGVSSTLVISSTLLVVSFWRLSTVPLGFDAPGALTVELRLMGSAYSNPDVVRVLQRNLIDRVSAIPGVRAVAMTSAVPFRGTDWRRGYKMGAESEFVAYTRHVDPAYFAIMRIPLRAGRLLTAEDRAGSPDVAVVSESFVQTVFGGAEAIGRVITTAARNLTVVGVVGDVRYASLAREPAPAVYVSATQQPGELICLLVETSGTDAAIGAAIREAVRAVDPTLPALHLATLGEILDGTLADRRFYTVATTTFAGLALVLTIVGLVTIVMRSVVERRKELAIRSALGASAVRLRGLVIWQAVLPVAGGVLAGVSASFVSAPALASFLFAVSPRETGVYLAASIILILSAVLAAWLAARQSSAIATAAVLRAD